MSDLDKDFEETVAQINAKLEESAKALREANKLAIKAGYKHGLINSQWAREAEEMPSEEDFESPEEYDKACDAHYDTLSKKYSLIDVGNLEDAMMDAGWQPSSSYC